MASRPQRRKPENRNAERIGLLNLLRPPSKVHAQAPSVTPEPALVNHAEKSANNSAVVVPSRPPGLDHGKNAWNHIEHIDLVRQAFHHGLTSAWPKGGAKEAKRGGEAAADASGTECSTSRCRRSATIRCPRGPSRRKEGSESRLSREYATSAISAQALLHQQLRSLKEDIFRILNTLIRYI